MQSVSGIFLKSQYKVYRERQRTLFLMFRLFPKYRLPHFPFMISLKDTSFHTVLSLSRMLFEFSLTLYSTMYGKTFSIYGVHTSKNVWNTLLLMSLFSTQNSKQRFLKSVSIKTKGVEKTMICFFKIQSENMRKTWDVGLFIFSIIYNQNIYDKLKTDYYQGNKIKIYQCSKKLVTERIEMLIQTPSRLSFRFS